MTFHCNADNSYWFVNGKETCKFKAVNKNANFPTYLCLRSISNAFSATDSREVCLNRNTYDFSVDYSSTDKSDILKINKYLMTEKNTK